MQNCEFSGGLLMSNEEGPFLSMFSLETETIRQISTADASQCLEMAAIASSHSVDACLQILTLSSELYSTHSGICSLLLSGIHINRHKTKFLEDQCCGLSLFGFLELCSIPSLSSH